MIFEAFKAVLDEEAAAERLVRIEVEHNGTWWAAHQIWKLRRQVDALQQAAKQRP